MILEIKDNFRSIESYIVTAVKWQFQNLKELKIKECSLFIPKYWHLLLKLLKKGKCKNIKNDIISNEYWTNALRTNNSTFKFQFTFPTLVIWDMNIHNSFRKLLSAYVFLSWRVTREIKNGMPRDKKDKNANEITNGRFFKDRTSVCNSLIK